MKRRDFLKVAGVSALALTLPGGALMAESSSTAYYGRILTLSPLYAQPKGQVISQALPDSVYQLLAYRDSWVRLRDGWVPETHIQPMIPHNSKHLEPLPAWAEVSAPYAALRRYADASAPLIERLGHGTVIQVKQSLSDRQGKLWLRAELSGIAEGWVQAEHLQATPQKPFSAYCEAHLQGHRLSLQSGEDHLGQFMVASPGDSGRGIHRIRAKLPSENGKSWVLLTHRGLRLHGVTTHNTFLRESQSGYIETSLVGARLLFALLPIGAPLIIS